VVKKPRKFIHERILIIAQVVIMRGKVIRTRGLVRPTTYQICIKCLFGFLPSFRTSLFSLLLCMMISVAKFPLSFCPTGMVPQKSDTAYVPITPTEIAEQVNEVSQIGITSVHLHARNDDGTPEYRKARFEKTIELIRNSNPEMVICVTTSGRTVAEFEKRADVLDISGDLKPEIAKDLILYIP